MFLLIILSNSLRRVIFENTVLGVNKLSEDEMKQMKQKCLNKKTNVPLLTLANWSALSHIFPKAGITLRWSLLCGGELELGWCIRGFVPIIFSFPVQAPLSSIIVSLKAIES